MTVRDLTNIFLRLQMAGKENECEFAFDAGRSADVPFSITGVELDEDGDVCLKCDEREDRTLTPEEIISAVSAYDPEKTIYFLSINSKGEAELYNIKDGGTFDMDDSDLRLIEARDLVAVLKDFDSERVPRFESGTINFTINSVYLDDYGYLCLESNEVDELDDYIIGDLLDELNACAPETEVYLYDDQAQEYYGIYPEELRVDEKGDVWINVR